MRQPRPTRSRTAARPCPRAATAPCPLRVSTVLASLLCITPLPAPSTALAQRVSWPHPDGTTHEYEAVSVQGGITWDEADQAATAAGGYLVTLTSAEENAFVFSLVDSAAFWHERPDGGLAGPWIGGFQPAGSPEPGTRWAWVTGEPVFHSHWSPGRPDERNGAGQNSAHFGGADSLRTPAWDDLQGDSPDVRGYVIEYSPGPPRTVGQILDTGGASPGYTLFAPLPSTTTYLIDNDGLLVHSWESDYPPGNSVYLLENGDLLRTATLQPGGHPTFRAGGAAGRVEEFDWSGNPVWSFDYSSPTHLSHHDIERLPNGNVLMIAWEYRSGAQTVAAGRDPALLPDGELWPDHVIEVEPGGPGGGTIVWEWHVWDHLIQDFDPTKANYDVVEDHPERIDINYVRWTGADWNHVNAIDYNEAFDQILVSVPTFREIWVIDHGTTTQEAAGHAGGRYGRGGDLLYRWGNPDAYRAGSPEDQVSWVQHDARWIEPGLPGAGGILLFDNGNGRPEGTYSTIDEIAPPVDGSGVYTIGPGGIWGPDTTAWRYTADNPGDFYSNYISGAERLPDGHTLVCEGSRGRFFEVTPAGEIVWAYVNPVTGDGPASQGDILADDDNPVFRAWRHAPDDPAFAGRDLTPGDPIERYETVGFNADDRRRYLPTGFALDQNRPNPFNPETVISFRLDRAGPVRLTVFDLRGRLVRTLVDEHKAEGLYSVSWDGRDDRGAPVSSGTYFYRLEAEGRVEARKSLLSK